MTKGEELANRLNCQISLSSNFSFVVLIYFCHAVTILFVQGRPLSRALHEELGLFDFLELLNGTS